MNLFQLKGKLNVSVDNIKKNKEHYVFIFWALFIVFICDILFYFFGLPIVSTAAPFFCTVIILLNVALIINIIHWEYKRGKIK